MSMIAKLENLTARANAMWSATDDKKMVYIHGYLDALRDASHEVMDHWNDAFAVTNQKDQAFRSSKILLSKRENIIQEMVKPQ